MGGWTRCSPVSTTGSERRARSCRSGPQRPRATGDPPPPAAARPDSPLQPQQSLAPAPPCSRADEARPAPTGTDPGAQHRPAALGGGGAAREARPSQALAGAARRPRAPWGRGGPRPARAGGPLGRPRAVTPPLTAPPPPLGQPRPRRAAPPTGATGQPTRPAPARFSPPPRDRELSRRRGISAPPGAVPGPAGGGPRPTGGGTGRAAPPRPAPRAPLVAKSPTPEARRAPSNAAAPPADVMETSASASRPPVAAARGRGEARHGAPPPQAPCLSPPLLPLPH
ncbi:proline-rich protein 2-like [Nyctibius grandis]|uniref:proline-rich protein 2-like n=1 Tax=Nyctibius grandis TaxID=48427 RepID=UPI0035BBE465